MDPERGTSGFARSIVLKAGLASADVLANARGSAAAAPIIDAESLVAEPRGRGRRGQGADPRQRDGGRDIDPLQAAVHGRRPEGAAQGPDGQRPLGRPGPGRGRSGGGSRRRAGSAESPKPAPSRRRARSRRQRRAVGRRGPVGDHRPTAEPADATSEASADPSASPEASPRRAARGEPEPEATEAPPARERRPTSAS